MGVVLAWVARLACYHGWRGWRASAGGVGIVVAWVASQCV